MKLKILENGEIEMILNCKGNMYKEVFKNYEEFKNYLKNFKIA